MKRVLVPGGRLLLLHHTGSTWPSAYAAQRLLEQVTGFQVIEAERLKAGTVERIHAVKPA